VTYAQGLVQCSFPRIKVDIYLLMRIVSNAASVLMPVPKGRCNFAILSQLSAKIVAAADF
jgi:hypothetical protein